MKISLLFLVIGFAKSNNISEEMVTLKSIIFGTYNCSIKYASHLVNIAVKHDQFCGGSLIAADWVLTAAHCCQKMKALDNFRVLFGQTIWMEDVQQTSKIEYLVIHKGFKWTPVILNDICLLKLKTSIETDDRVKISNLATPEDYDDMIKNKKCNKVITMGFGDQRNKVVKEKKPGCKHSNFSENVHCFNLKFIYDDKNCQEGKSSPSKSLFCAYDPKGKGRDFCQGDSGGPVFCKELQIGLVTSGSVCGMREYPGFYSRVDTVNDFIEHLVPGTFNKFKPRSVDRSSGITLVPFCAILIFIYSVGTFIIFNSFY